MNLIKNILKLLFIIMWFILAIIILYFTMTNDYSKITFLDITLITIGFIYALISVKIRKVLGDIFVILSYIIDIIP